MRKFIVTINGKTQEHYADSLTKLKNMLRHELKKRRLAGVKIEEKKNNINNLSPSPLLSKETINCCYICGESRDDELTVTDPDENEDLHMVQIICVACQKAKKRNDAKQSKAAIGD